MPLSSDTFGNAFNAAPRPLRSFIIDGKLQEAVKSIVTARKLHVDIGGVLEDGASQMLVGLISPAELLGELILAGVEGETAKTILEDLNTQIFIPIRESIRHFQETGEDLISPTEDDVDTLSLPEGEPTPITSDSAALKVEVQETAPQPSASPRIVSAPLLPPMTLVSPIPELSFPTPSVSTASPIPAPIPTTPSPQSEVLDALRAPISVASAQSPNSAPEHPTMRTMATDMQAVKEHRSPEAVLPHPAPTPTFAPPVPSAHASPVVFPPPLPPSSHKQLSMPARTAPPPPNLPGTPLMPSYSTDPYREAPE